MARSRAVSRSSSSASRSRSAAFSCSSSPLRGLFGEYTANCSGRSGGEALAQVNRHTEVLEIEMVHMMIRLYRHIQDRGFAVADITQYV
jgi:hypothetical protein